MVVAQQRSTALVMTGPRLVAIRREAIIARPAPAPQRTRWQCSICGKLLSSKRSYDEHLNIHNQARPFTCDHCDYAAASQMTLRRHILRNHTSRDDWHYKCPYCGETYMEPASYQQHVSSRHFGRSATFGCPFTACTFQTKCSKHFKEHLVKHHNCPSTRRSGGQEEDEAESSSRIPSNPSSITDENLQQYLVDDDLGVGFGRRTSSIARPIIRSNGEIESSVDASAERTPKIEEVESKGLPLEEIASSVGSSITPLVPPQRRMVVLRKSERNNDQMLTFPSTSSTLISSPRPPPLSREEHVYQLPVTDDDFMKAPITLRRSMPLPPPSNTARRVQLAPMGRRMPPSLPMTHRGRSMVGGVKEEEETKVSTPVTLGGSRHAPAMISADADVWMIEHEEEVDEGAKNVHVYDNGSTDYDID